MKTDWVIKTISKLELDRIVTIHIEALPDDVLPNLGGKILNNYYREILLDGTQELFGVFSAKDVLGFCLISTAHVGLSNVMISAQGVGALIRLILTRPQILYSGVIQALKRREISEGVAEISFIAVSPKYQGRAIGSDMLDYANQWCRERRIAFLQTKTANQLLRDFYVRVYRAEEIGGYDLLGRHYSELKWATTPTGSIPCTA